MGINYTPTDFTFTAAISAGENLRRKFAERHDAETHPQVAHNWGVYRGHKEPKTPKAKFRHDVYRGLYPKH